MSENPHLERTEQTFEYLTLILLIGAPRAKLILEIHFVDRDTFFIGLWNGFRFLFMQIVSFNRKQRVKGLKAGTKTGFVIH